MPRYYFNIVVRRRKIIPDPEGDELAGDEEAREHAKIIALDMLDNHTRYKRGLEHWAFEITNEAGRRVEFVAFTEVMAKRRRCCK